MTQNQSNLSVHKFEAAPVDVRADDGGELTLQYSPLYG
jgi:hypothetical protein